MVFHLSWCTGRWSLKRYLSLTLARSCLQRLRVSALFPIPFAMPSSQDRDPDAQFHYNPISYCGPWYPSTWLLGEVFSHTLQLTQGSGSGISHPDCSSLWGPISSSTLTEQTDFVSLVFLLLCRGYCCWHRLFLWFGRSWGGHNALLSSSPWGCCLVSSSIQK